MGCLTCQHENKPSAKFCSNCGSKIELVCSQCGAKVDPDVGFCSECSPELKTSGTSTPGKTDSTLNVLSYTPSHLAKRILNRRTLMEGERRTITVLYADAKGFPPISEYIGAEAVYETFKISGINPW